MTYETVIKNIMNSMPEISKERIYSTCKPITMLSKERIFANISSVEKIIQDNIPGDIIEIGVWKGGSMLAMILALEELNQTRNIKLYDTFEGMTAPTNKDYDMKGNSAESFKNDALIKAYAPLEVVKNNIYSNIKNSHNISFIKGDILNTSIFPDSISILRLDTDWYESTKFELENFYPLVHSGGAIIIDDYGHWAGAKLAVDEFIAGKNIELLKIDYTGRMFFKK